jgi:hypothetical protein
LRLNSQFFTRKAVASAQSEIGEVTQILSNVRNLGALIELVDLMGDSPHPLALKRTQRNASSHDVSQPANALGLSYDVVHVLARNSAVKPI